MNWTGMGDFFAMGGYGLYVWGSYAIAAVVMILEPLLAAHRHHKALRHDDELDEQE
jgi:heme exporter protein D